MFKNISLTGPALVAALLASACAGSTPASTTPAAATAAATTPSSGIAAALAGDWRKPEEKARDGARHPAETLQFFGLTETMSVIELSPSAGWYTAILAPVLRDKGQLTIAGGDPNGPPDSEGTKGAKVLADRFAARADVFGKAKSVVLKPKQPWNLGADASADMVLTFRNLHNWVAGGSADQALDEIHRVLKAGGTFGVVDHRAKPGSKADPESLKSGYIPEDFVIALVEKHGFKLAAKSEINANPKDTKDYPEGVWTLPPSYELGAKDHAKYEAIGESDRMTLKFVKN